MYTGPYYSYLIKWRSLLSGEKLIGKGAEDLTENANRIIIGICAGGGFKKKLSKLFTLQIDINYNESLILSGNEVGGKYRAIRVNIGTLISI